MSKQPKATTFKVVAIKRGFFGGIYRTPGDGLVFEVTEAEYSARWMEKTNSKKKRVTEKREDGYIPLEAPSLINKYAWEN